MLEKENERSLTIAVDKGNWCQLLQNTVRWTLTCLRHFLQQAETSKDRDELGLLRLLFTFVPKTFSWKFFMHQKAFGKLDRLVPIRQFC